MAARKITLWSRATLCVLIPTTVSLAAPESAAQVRPQTKATPILNLWKRALQTKDTPAFLPSELLTTSPLPVIKWQDTDGHAIVGMDGVFSPQKRQSLVQVGYAGNTGPAKTLFLRTNAGKAESLKWDTASSWLHLLQWTNNPLAIQTRLNKPAPSQKDVTHKLVELEFQDGGLKISPADAPIQGAKRYFQQQDPKTHALEVLDSLTGERVGAPLPLKPFADKGFRSLDHAVTKDELILGGFEMPYDRPARMVWNRLKLGQTAWQRETKTIDKNYLTSILPASLKGISPFAEGVLRSQILQDGSIVFVLFCEQQQAEESLFGRFLVIQPRSGKPRLINWTLHYTSDSIVQQIWYPGPAGRIDSSSSNHYVGNDFHFCIDEASNSLLYLLRGRIWRIEMNR